MMSGSDLETSIDIWEETARDLLRIDSSKDTRTVIEKHTNTIHTVLENKLSEEEAKLQKEVKTEEEAIQTLKGRIQESQSETSNSSDTFLFDAKTLYQRIKEQEWSEVYDILIEQTTDSETLICAKLINILKECYNICDQKIQSVCEEIKHDIASPGSSETQKPKVDKKMQSKQKSKEPDDLSIIVEEFLKKTGQGIFPYHKQLLIDHVTESKGYQSIQMKGWEAGKTFEMYIIKCLEFCWIQILENKEVMIEDNLKALSKIMPHKYKKIEPSKVTVTWPALVDTENIVEDAVLENKADMAAVRLSKKQTTGKGKSEDTEDVTEQYNIDSHGNSKPVSKGENGKSYDVDKTKGSPSKLPGEVEHKESKLSGRDAPGAKQEEKSEQSERDAPTVKPRVESGESSSDKSKTGSQIQKQQTNKTSASGKKQTSKTHPTSKNLDF